MPGGGERSDCSLADLLEHDHLARLDRPAVDQHLVAVVEVVGQRLDPSVEAGPQLGLLGAHRPPTLGDGIAEPRAPTPWSDVPRVPDGRPPA